MKLKEKLLSDIEKFKKHYSEPNHSDYVFFRDYVVNNYPIPKNEKLNLKIDLCKRLTPWLKSKGVFSWATFINTKGLPLSGMMNSISMQ